MTEDMLNIEWITQESEAQNVQQAMQANGSVSSSAYWEPDADLVDEYGDSQFEPLMIIGGVVAAGWLIKKISDVMMDWKRPGGMLVDTRHGKVVMRPAPRAPRGAIVMVTSKESKVIQPDNRDTTLEALTALFTQSHA